eukprot:gene2013-12987_t
MSENSRRKSIIDDDGVLEIDIGATSMSSDVSPGLETPVLSEEEIKRRQRLSERQRKELERKEAADRKTRILIDKGKRFDELMSEFRLSKV